MINGPHSPTPEELQDLFRVEDLRPEAHPRSRCDCHETVRRLLASEITLADVADIYDGYYGDDDDC